MKNIVFPLILFTTMATQASANNGYVKNSLGEATDTLNILFSATNHIYYFTSPMAEDASNLKSANANNIRLIVIDAQQDAKQRSHSLVIILKMQDEKSLNESSKKAIVYIKGQPGNKPGKLTETENYLIRLIEQDENKN